MSVESGETRLYRAVMMQTVRDVLDRPGPECSPIRMRALLRRTQRAMAWVDDDSCYAFSFRDCCRVLGLNYLRARKVMVRFAGDRPAFRLRNRGRPAAWENALVAL